MGTLFEDSKNFNEHISAWDVRQAEDLSFMFNSASSFNQPLGASDVRRAESLSFMFANASSFNRPLGAWVVGPGASTEGAPPPSFDRAANMPGSRDWAARDRGGSSIERIARAAGARKRGS